MNAVLETAERSSEQPLKVLIADDHPLMLAGVRRALEHSENIEIVGEAHTARNGAPETILKPTQDRIARLENQSLTVCTCHQRLARTERELAPQFHGHEHTSVRTHLGCQHLRNLTD
jgi:hypothetical protein